MWSGEQKMVTRARDNFTEIQSGSQFTYRIWNLILFYFVLVVAFVFFFFSLFSWSVFTKIDRLHFFLFIVCLLIFFLLRNGKQKRIIYLWIRTRTYLCCCLNWHACVWNSKPNKRCINERTWSCVKRCVVCHILD